MAVSIQQAAANALGAHVATKLGAGVDVSYEWPVGPLPAKAVTVLLAGPPKDEYLQPSVVSSQAVANPNHRLYRWRVLERTQPLQLDVWAQYQATRDDMIAALDVALNTGFGTAGDPVGNGLVLALGDGWTGRADFVFEGPDVDNGPEAARQSEWRATYRGEARVALYVDAESAKMAQIILKQQLGITTTVTASGATHS